MSARFDRAGQRVERILVRLEIRPPAALVGDPRQRPLRLHQLARGAIDIVGDLERAAEAAGLGAHDHEVLHVGAPPGMRSEEHTSELQSLMRNSYAVFCLKKKKTYTQTDR